MNTWLADLIPTALAPSVIERIGWMLVHSLWQFTSMALLAAVMLRLSTGSAATARYSMLSVLLIAMPIAPAATWWCTGPDKLNRSSSAISVPEGTENARPNLSLEVGSNGLQDGSSEPGSIDRPLERTSSLSSIPSLEGSSEKFATIPASSSQGDGWFSRIANFLHPWLTHAVIVWAIGVFVFSWRLILSYWTMRRLCKVGVSEVNEELLQKIASLKRTMRVKRSVRILHSSLVPTPVVVGIFRSVILLPVSLLSNLPPCQLEAILVHELAHVNRYDNCINLFQAMVETLFFYHPAVWWISKRIRIERENCCDDTVVSVLKDRIAYGKALLALEERRGTYRSLALGVTDGSLLYRIQRLANPRTMNQPSSASGFATILLVTFLMSWMTFSLFRNRPVHRPAPSVAQEDEPKREPFRLPDHWIVVDLRYTANDRELVTLSVQGGVNVRRWDVESRKLLSEIKLLAEKHQQPYRQETLQLSSDGKHVLAATDDYVGIWDAESGDLMRKLEFPKEGREYDCVRCLDCSSDLSIVVGGLGTHFSRTTLVYSGYGIIWNGKTGDVRDLVTHQGGFYFADIAVSPDGSRFATCNEHGTAVCIWDTKNGSLVHELTQEITEWTSPDPDLISNNIVNAIAFSPDGSRLAVSGTFGLKIFEMGSASEVLTIDSPYRFYNSRGVFFSPDGKRIARIGTPGTEDNYSVPIWSTASGGLLSELATSANSVAFTNDGRTLAVANSDFNEALAIWPVEEDGREHRISEAVQARDTVNRVEENTHMRGKSAQELVDRWKPVWGEPMHGLQYGLASTVPSRQFPLGGRVWMVAFLRNSSDRTLQFALRPDMFGNLPSVEDAKGQNVNLITRPLLGSSSDYRDQLEPGESFGPLYLNMGLGPNPNSNAQTWEPFMPIANEGKYRLIHRVKFQVAPPEASSDTSTDAWLTGSLSSGSLDCEVVQDKTDSTTKVQYAPETKEPPSQDAEDPSRPWRAKGRVVDQDGRPMSGVTVRAATGVGTLRGGGSGLTNRDGFYDFRFGMGVLFGKTDDGKPSPQTQYALISASLDGYFEKNFSRHGKGIASLSPVDEAGRKHWGIESDQVCLPDQPRELHFVMLPAAKVAGTLVGEDERPLAEYSVSLTADELPPGSSVLAQVITDDEGRFEIRDIPTTIAYQFVVRKPRSQLGPPWNDSWASGPISFLNPDERDLVAKTIEENGKEKRFMVKSFQLKILGPGIGGKTALAKFASIDPIGEERKSKGIQGDLEVDRYTLTISNENAGE